LNHLAWALCAGLALLGIILALLARPVYAAGITVDGAGDIVAVDGFCALREAIQSANNDANINADCAGSGLYGADTIFFSPALAGQTITLGGTELLITSPLTIDGVGVSTLTVSGNDASRVFNISGIGVDSNIANLIISNGRTAGAGGGIFAANALTLTNVTVQRSAESGGGGVYAGNGLTLVNSLFSGNLSSGNSGGGAYVQNGNALVTGGSFIGNRADSSGGGLLVITGTTTLSGTQFSGNRATNNDGAGVWARNAGLTNAYFEDNQAGGAGGGVRVFVNLVTTNTQFINNRAGSNGGGAQATGAATVSDGQFSGNTAALYGGGLAAFGGLTLTNVAILSNTAQTNNGGGAFVNSGGANVSGGSFINNQAQGHGGGLNVGGGLSLSRSQFLGNFAQTDGGGLYFTGSSGQIINTLFARNAVAGSGVGIYVLTSGTLELIHATLTNPTLATGSAIFVNSGTVNITNTIIASHTTGIQQTSGTANEDYKLFFGNTTD
jgi:predicted outer membrane repeat protein